MREEREMNQRAVRREEESETIQVQREEGRERERTGEREREGRGGREREGGRESTLQALVLFLGEGEGSLRCRRTSHFPHRERLSGRDAAAAVERAR